MTDVRTQLADALRDGMREQGGFVRHDNSVYMGSTRAINPDHLADVLLSLPGVAVVELPNAQPAWHGALTSWPVMRSTSDGVVEIRNTDGRIGVNGIGFPIDTPAEARQLAAALLAAARQAETVNDAH